MKRHSWLSYFTDPPTSAEANHDKKSSFCSEIIRASVDEHAPTRSAPAATARTQPRAPHLPASRGATTGSPMRTGGSSGATRHDVGRAAFNPQKPGRPARQIRCAAVPRFWTGTYQGSQVWLRGSQPTLNRAAETTFSPRIRRPERPPR